MVRRREGSGHRSGVRPMDVFVRSSDGRRSGNNLGKGSVMCMEKDIWA